MFRKIYVPVDNSDYSNRAIDLAVELGRAFGSTLTGCHVYAARLHDYRFKQMEYTLPEEYRDEHELERQRKIHDSLIAMGLQLVSDSYLEVMRKKTEAAGLPRMIIFTGALVAHFWLLALSPSSNFRCASGVRTTMIRQGCAFLDDGPQRKASSKASSCSASSGLSLNATPLLRCFKMG